MQHWKTNCIFNILKFDPALPFQKNIQNVNSFPECLCIGLYARFGEPVWTKDLSRKSENSNGKSVWTPPDIWHCLIMLVYLQLHRLNLLYFALSLNLLVQKKKKKHALGWKQLFYFDDILILVLYFYLIVFEFFIICLPIKKTFL